MRISRRGLLLGATGLGAAPRVAAAETITVGVLADLSGPYRDISGPLATECVRQAIDDFGPTGHGFDVRVLDADHRNNVETGLRVATEWLDHQGVDMIIDCPSSDVALAVAGLCAARDRVFIPTTAATAELTGEHCAATTVHWAMDSWMVAHATGGALMREGGDTWFFVTADTALGRAIERDTAAFVTGAGGRVLGSALAPFAAADFTTAMERARGSGAKVVGLCNAGGDVEHAILAAHAQRLAEQGTRLAAMLVFVSDIHTLGLEVAQGLLLTSSFYWDFDHRSRKLSRRLQTRIGDARIGMGQAGDYAATLHYLKAVAAMGVAAARRSGAATVAQMSAMPTDDDAFGRGRIRADGRVLHPVHLFQVKSLSESTGPWDYYRLLETVPSDKAARPMAAGLCKLVPH